ncbi:uncharacterized protein LOC112555671 isoform X1 [Pomacea canaliculata]|uniref:uncharacterized protein LOC112555671 isoform X1 n=1 Tax=Pomacea canaliculata TaxID=400727 RepID=UPI000D7322B4|nr:uncharacterized protein LOC112555671 isoform X1 [Pomacea canaliculata]XP_025079925.1 uncharacterized protein LOC112555671 isoform X1 [Pomacea canaliculata]XP_025079926.1 uncharacterized protein LOC112555671 isoform X1 [Pomacea canaliculata]
METFLRRAYLQDGAPCDPRQYPVWDYRSRRSSFSTSCTSTDNSSLSTSPSRMDVEMTEGDSILSSSDVDSLVLRDPSRLMLELMVDLHEIHPLLELYEPLIFWVDPDLHLFRVSEHDGNGPVSSRLTFPKSILRNGQSREGQSELLSVYRTRQSTNCRRNSLSNLDPRTGCLGCRDGHRVDSIRSNGQLTNPDARELPAVSVVVFLHEEEIKPGGRVDSARKHLSQSAWKFHHCEQTSRKSLNLNSQAFDYYFISEDLPFLAVRQVHYGKEHVRVLVNTNFDTWADMVNFYQLLLGFRPDLVREDFCLFTVHSQINFDLQFALKRLDPGSTFTRVIPMQSSRLQFKVADLGHLVPLLPNVCRPVSDTRWLTTDHDGNEVILDVTDHGLASSTSSLSDRASSESCTSTCSSDVSFDSHDSGVSRGGSCSSGSRQQAPTVKRRRWEGDTSDRGRRRVTFCFDDTTPPVSTTFSPATSPATEHYLPLAAKPDTSPEVRFTLKFDTCPTAPGDRNSKRTEQIGFYV